MVGYLTIMSYNISVNINSSLIHACYIPGVEVNADQSLWLETLTRGLDLKFMLSIVSNQAKLLMRAAQYRQRMNRYSSTKVY